LTDEIVGGDGVVAGVASIDVDGAEMPAAFVAVTAKE
jgi:hypothetical protein